MTEVIIRPGLQADLPAVLDLVRELALYEQAPDEVHTTLADYERDFGHIFHTIVAETDGRIVGMALYFMTFSTWKGRMLWLEDFIVTQSYRQAGIGRVLFEAVLTEARRRQVVQVKWQVLDWNEPAIRFYERYPVTFDKDWWNVRLLLDQ